MKLNFLHQNTEKRRDLILNGRVSASLLLLSIPTLMMGLVQSLMPLMDGLFMNNFAGTVAASSVTYCFPIINMMSALAQGISVAGTAMIGQANGRGEFKEARHLSTQIITFALVSGCIIAPLLVLVAFPVSWNVDPRISHDVFTYLALNSMVLPFLFLENTYNAVKNASGKPEAPFIRMVIMLLLKVLFNVLFIAVLKLGIVGSVMSSLVSNVLISIWMYYELFIKQGDDRLELKGFRYDFTAIREIVRMGVPSMLNSIMLSLGFYLINNEIQKYGPVVLNGQGIASNITSIAFILPSSFGASVTTIVSMNVGAGKGLKARKGCIAGCLISAVTAAALIALIVPLSSYITILFTRDKAVLDVANHALHIYTYSVIGFGICMVSQGAFIGLGRMRIPLVMGILRIWLLRYIFILATENFLSYSSVFWGNLFSNYLAALITTILVFNIKWVSVIPKYTNAQDLANDPALNE